MSTHGKMAILPTQRLFLGVAGVFVLFLLGFAFYRSFSRQSVLGGNLSDISKGAAIAGQVLTSLGQGEGGSAMQLQDFHRVEVKNGRPSWEIRAKDAKYFSDAGLTQIHDADLTIFRSGNGKVGLRSKAAKLFVTDGQLSKAVMEGDVVVNIDDSMFLQTQFLTFDVNQKRILAPNEAVVNGAGYQVKGQSFSYDIEPETLIFDNTVSSRFETWANAPKNLANIHE